MTPTNYTELREWASETENFKIGYTSCFAFQIGKSVFWIYKDQVERLGAELYYKFLKAHLA